MQRGQLYNWMTDLHSKRRPSFLAWVLVSVAHWMCAILFLLLRVEKCFCFTDALGTYLSLSYFLISVFPLSLFLYWLLCCFVVIGSPAVTDVLPDKLVAALVPDQGYHQVGPADLCSDMFILSVTVAFATKLEQVRTDVHGSQCF